MKMRKWLWPLLLCLLLLCPAALGAEDADGSDEPPESPLPEPEAGEVFVIEDGRLLEYTGDSTFVLIPAEVTRIDGGAFSAAPLIREVVLHSGILSIDVGTFVNCPEVSLSLVEGTMPHDFAVEYNLSYKTYADDAALPQPPEEPQEPSSALPSATPTPEPPTPTPETVVSAKPPVTEAPAGALRGFFSDMTRDSWITLGIAAAELVLLVLLVLVIVSALRSRGKKEKK